MASEQQVFVRGLEGRTLVLPLRPRATAGQLIAATAAKSGMPPGSHADLGLVYAGRQLPPATLLADLGVRHGSTLHLSGRLRGGQPIKVQLLVPPAGGGPSEVEVQVEAGSPMWEVKLQLQELTGVPVEHQEVMLAGIGRMVMLDRRSNIGRSYCGSTPNFALALMGAASSSSGAGTA